MFTVTEWGKLHHTELDRDFLHTDDHTTLLEQALKPREEKSPMLERPEEVSRFLELRKHQPTFLFCSLTRKMIPNSLFYAEKHTGGWLYKRKMYEFWKNKMLKKRRIYD